MKKNFLLLVLIFSAGCASLNYPKDGLLSEKLAFCISLYEKKDYYHASLFFPRLVPYIRATAYEDEVYFHLGMSHYHIANHSAAIQAFQAVLNNSAPSKYKRKSLFMKALSYYKLSPKFQLDPSTTQNAIQHLQLFIDTYPAEDIEETSKNLKEIRENMEHLKEDSLLYSRYKKAEGRLIEKLGQADTSIMAEKKILELRDRLAEKIYNAGYQYELIDYYTAAKVYYNDIISHYADSKFYGPSLLGKIRMLLSAKAWKDAIITIEKYETLFPDKVKEVSRLRTVAIYGLDQGIAQKEKESLEEHQRKQETQVLYIYPN